jgi:lantibiotic modifying enzyme
MKNKNEWVKYYNETGKLPELKVPCTQCGTGSTMFGSNLENRITKFGCLSHLLDTFKCRACVGASKPKKAPKEKKIRLKKQKQEEIKNYEIPKMKFSIPRNVFLKDAPDIVESMSENGICLSPSYYLDHDKQCGGCAFFSDCKCALKAA